MQEANSYAALLLPEGEISIASSLAKPQNSFTAAELFPIRERTAEIRWGPVSHGTVLHAIRVKLPKGPPCKVEESAKHTGIASSGGACPVLPAAALQ